MKKILVSAILGLAAVVSVQAQSAIQLYAVNLPAIVYGASSGGTLGNGVGPGFTVGVYYAAGAVDGAVNGVIGGSTTQAGANNGTLVGSGLTLGTGVGATVATEGSGEYYSIPSHAVSVAAPTGSPTVTVVLVAYNGASYEASTIRGHSAAFTMTAVSAPGFALQTGAFAPQFAVAAVPEPSTFALAGLGLAGLLIFRRRK
jgi:hypothetical protein